MAGIKAYENALAAAKARLDALLRSGAGSASLLATARRSQEIMAAELKSPKSVLVYDSLPGDKATGFKGADHWRLACERKAADEINPQYLSQEDWLKKAQAYNDLGLRIVTDKRVRQQAVVDRQRGVSYIIHGELPIVADVMKTIASELTAWFRAQPNSKSVMSMSPEAGLATMLAGRPDLVLLCRLAQNAPLDSETRSVPVDRPAAVQAIELAVALVPFVGNAVAAYEAYAGVDLFGYHLTDVERGILGASVLLPIAGRLVKGGRILYSEARLVSLYGRDAASWSKVVSASGRAEGAATGKALRDVELAGTELRLQKQLVDQAAKDAAPAIPAVIKGSSSASASVDAEVAKLLGELHTSNSLLKNAIDAPALQRILEKGPNVDHLKGQLLEELVESRIVPWLRDRTGSYALGVTVPAGKKLEFIPGHMIRDIKGRQITDGVLAYRDGNALNIVAVFEAKAGKSAARELSLSKSSLSSLSKGELAELRANAKDVWRERRLEAKRSGGTYAGTVDDVMKEYALSELGGQIRRDIERLAPSGGNATLNVGSERLTVSMSPTKTKFFGVIPKNTSSGAIEKQLQAEKVAYEILGVDLKDTELKTLAEKMKPLAEKMAGAAP